MVYKSFNIIGDPDVIGVKNGVTQIEIDKNNFKSEKALDDFHLSFPEDPKRDIEVIHPLKYKLLKGGKINDFMFYGYYIKAIPFIISEKGLKVMQSHSLMEFSLLDVEINNYKSEAKFYLFRYPFIELQQVEFKDSLIYTGNNLIGKKYYELNSYEDFVELKKSIKTSLLFEKVVLKKLDNTVDFVRLRGVGEFISPKLEQEFICRNISGPQIGRPNSPILEFK